MVLTLVGVIRLSLGPARMTEDLYPNLSQCVAKRAQTAQSEPNGAFSFHQLTSDPDAITRFAKPLYWLKPVPGVRIPRCRPKFPAL